MGFFSADMESMVDVYQRETVELMEEYENRLMEAVRRSRLTEEDINSIFRIVHTIKSSSAMMGMEELSGCTHRMEDLFLIFREVPKRMESNESRIFDLLYAYEDYVNGEMEQITEEDFLPSAAGKLRDQIEGELDFFGQKVKEESKAEAETGSGTKAERNQGILTGDGKDGNGKTEDGKREDEKTENGKGKDRKGEDGKGEDGKTENEKAGNAEEMQDGNSHMWKVHFKKKCQMVNVRAFMLLKQIEKFCTGISTIPSDLEKTEAAEQIEEEGLLLTIRTVHLEAVARSLAASPYVEQITDLDAEVKNKEKTENAGKQGENEKEARSRTGRFSTVPWEQVVRLQEITGELITANAVLKAALEKLPEYRNLEGFLLTNQRLLADLEDVANGESLMQVSSAVGQYYRIVRDICKQEGKQVDFQIRGEELEADRTLLDGMASPLIHLLRNAVDHGIEKPQVRKAAGKPVVGNVLLTVEASDGNLRFTISDDGAGIDNDALLKRAREKGLLVKEESRYQRKEILNLIFLPGFSTAETISRYSGRGVGLDVVQSTVEALGGIVQVESVLGKGSTFTIEVPVSMTSKECIRFWVGEYHCLLPIRSVEHIGFWKETVPKLQKLEGRVWMERNGLIPVIDLRKLFGEPLEKEPWVVVIQGIKQRAALLTGEVTGEQIVVEKPLPPILEQRYRREMGVSGCTIIEDGSQGLVLGAENLIRIYQREGRRNG